jgi:hypothetical protein
MYGSHGDGVDSQSQRQVRTTKGRRRSRRNLKPWDDDDTTVYVDETTGEKYHPATSPWNAHGVFHVRLLRAERLPCPVGSSVNAVVSLPPYKGKVRTQRKNAFLGTSSIDDGVCIQWGEEITDREQIGEGLVNEDDNITVLQYYNPNETDDINNVDGLCSMVNAWSSDESPVPTIRIQLMFSPLGMGLFEFTMCSIDLSCHVLLRNAGVWRSRWVAMDVPAPSGGSRSGSQTSNNQHTSSSMGYRDHEDRIPLLYIQAVFVPTIPSDVTSVALSLGSASASRTFSRTSDAFSTVPTDDAYIAEPVKMSSTKPSLPLLHESEQQINHTKASVGTVPLSKTMCSTSKPTAPVDADSEINIRTSFNAGQQSLQQLGREELVSTNNIPPFDINLIAGLECEDSLPPSPNEEQTADNGIRVDNSSSKSPTKDLSETHSGSNDLSATPIPAEPQRVCREFSNYDEEMESVNMEYCEQTKHCEQTKQQAQPQEGKEESQNFKTVTQKSNTISSFYSVGEGMFEPSAGNHEPIELAKAGPGEPTKSISNSKHETTGKNSGIPLSIGHHVTAIDDNSITDDISLASKTVFTSGTAAGIEPHLLRAENYWMPTLKCAVCSRTLFGRKGGFRCEACNLDVCGDCRLNVDIRVPCRSNLAKQFVAESKGNQVNLSKILSIIAPDDMFEEKRIKEESQHDNTKDLVPSTIGTGTGWNRLSTTLGEDAEKSIGVLRLEIIRACIYEQNLSSYQLLLDASGSKSMPDVRVGDYYVRVSTTGSDKSTRTPTIQNTGIPNFQATEIKIPLSHYGMQFRLDVIDASAECVVGSTILTTQGLLQEQRDQYLAAHGVSLFQFVKGPIPWHGTRTMKIELRSGLKTGITHDFLLATPKTDETGKKSNAALGAIIGWIEIDVGVEEFTHQLYGPNPIECPARPTPEFNIAIFNGHIARISSLIADVKVFLFDLSYLYSWKNPFITVASLYIFVHMCIYFNAEYSGSLPFLIVSLLSLYCAFRRSLLETKQRFIQRKADATRMAAETSFVGYQIFRPRGMVSLSVTKGRNLVSQEFGIAGNVACNVYWDAVRFADEETKKEILKGDKSVECPIDIGRTRALYTVNADWDGMEESLGTKRLTQILPSSEKDFFDNSSSSVRQNSLHFPVLQPFKVDASLGIDGEGRFKGGELQDWTSSKGAVVMEVKFEDFLNNLPGFDHVIGEVAFPFSELAKRREIKGWFYLQNDENGFPVPSDGVVSSDGANLDGTSSPPMIYVHLEWNPPPPRQIGVEPNEHDREVSYVVQEELVRSCAQTKSRKKFDIVGSSLGAVNTAFGIGNTLQMIQNTLGSVLDTVEAAINAFNFTDPFKSSIILAALLCLWLILFLVPTRFLVLGGGLVPYIIGFLDEYGEVIGLRSKQSSPFSTNDVFANDQQKTAKKDESSSDSPVAVWIMNALRSLPTIDDLRKAYIWEIMSLGAEQKEQHAFQKRETRLAKLWKAAWHSPLKIFMQGDDVKSSPHWRPCFAVVQGHRFLWWHGVDDFDNGELPAGRLLLSGHAGLGTPSPLEIRCLSKDDLSLCLSLFGRGEHGQQRVTMVLPDEKTKIDIERVINESSSFKND